MNYVIKVTMGNVEKYFAWTPFGEYFTDDVDAAVSYTDIEDAQHDLGILRSKQHFEVWKFEIAMLVEIKLQSAG